jgi:RES domain-containing protein
LIRCWRIVHQNNNATAFSGEGSRKQGGRWTGRGYRAVYTADSLALATLEVIVHGVTYASLRNFVCIPVNFSDEIVTSLSADQLPEVWRADPPSTESQAIGNRWIDQAVSCVLKVPSAVIPIEFNYILNPNHPGFSRIQIGVMQPWAPDPRLFSRLA